MTTTVTIITISITSTIITLTSIVSYGGFGRNRYTATRRSSIRPPAMSTFGQVYTAVLDTADRPPEQDRE